MPTLHLTDVEVRLLDDLLDVGAPDEHVNRQTDVAQARSALQMLRGKIRVQLNKIDKRIAKREDAQT